jgi:hypothetical protein
MIYLNHLDQRETTVRYQSRYIGCEDPGLSEIAQGSPFKKQLDDVAAAINEAMRTRLKLQGCLHDLDRAVEIYNACRWAKLQEIMQSQDLGWCTMCYMLFPNSEIGLLYREFDHDRDDQGDSFLDQVCPECLKEWLSKSGGRNVSYTFWVFEGRRREDGAIEVFRKDDGDQWQPIPDRTKICHIPEPGDNIHERLANKLNLPPQITFNLRAFPTIPEISILLRDYHEEPTPA